MREIKVLFLILAFQLVIGGSFVSFAEERSEDQLEKSFKELSSSPKLDISFASIKILAQVSSWDHWDFDLLYRTTASFRPADETLISYQKNPFYKDKKDEYQEFINILKKAKEKEGLNKELENFLSVAEWRISRLEKSSNIELAFNQKLDKINTDDALKKLIAEYGSYGFSVKAKAKLESILIKKLKSDPSKAKFVIRDIKPDERSYTAKITVVCSGSSSDYSFLSTDRYPDDGPLQFRSNMMAEFPMGNESVHRYEGECKPISFGKDEYKISGEKEDPLTFFLLKGRGYLYLHGKGHVILPSGKEVTLGY